MTLRLWLVFVILQFIGKSCSGLVITECQNEKATVGEGTKMSLTCGKYDVDMEWTYGDDQRTVIGQCDRARCITHHNRRFSLQAHKTGSNQYESVLSITNILSEQNFHLKCRSKDLDETARCLLHVVKPPQYDPTTCKVWVSNWRVLGECTVERMAASSIDYNCYWSVNNKGKFGGFKENPSYYALRSENYTRSVCSFNKAMDVLETSYTYRIHVSGLKDHYNETITVEHPGEATHNCPTMVGEGSTVTCRCNTSKAGNPPADTVWDGVKNETLHIENIQRQTKTNVYTCRVVWGSDWWINRYTLHTFDVAYGPSSVRIDYIIDETGNERDMLRLMCTAVDVHPSAIFRWNITCDNQTHNSNTSTCSFSAANVSQGTVVMCIAINNFSSNMLSFNSFVVDVTVEAEEQILLLVPNLIQWSIGPQLHPSFGPGSGRPFPVGTISCKLPQEESFPSRLSLCSTAALKKTLVMYLKWRLMRLLASSKKVIDRNEGKSKDKDLHFIHDDSNADHQAFAATGLVITECQNDKATVGEGTNVTLTCGEYNKGMKWMYEDDQRTVIGQCNRTTCTANNSFPFSLQAHETESKQYESVLSITNIVSEQPFHLKCRNEDMDEYVNCLLHVVKPPQYDPATCKVWVSNWRVLGECTVERIPASSDDYKCYWSMNNEGKFGGFKEKPSYYTLHSINYARRVCSFNRSMNFTENAFTYSMIVPGSKEHFAQTITVEHPGEPTHTCPTMVSEGSSVTCRCNTSKAGNPPATTVWDGVKNEILHIENIQRQTKTRVYTCRVVWGSDGWINNFTLHTFDVAYGPSSVHIIDETGNERDMIHLMCTAVDVHPSAIFRWNITCDTQTQNSNTSTCALSTANVSPETVVTCTAINNFSSDMSSLSSFVVDHTGGKSSGSENDSSDVFTVLFPALITIVIIVIVIALLYRRKVLMSKRRKSFIRASLHETEESAPESPTTSSTVHYVNTMARIEETEKGAKCNNDTLQSNGSTDYDEVCDRLAPERCAAPSGDLYTTTSKESHDLNRETSDHNNPTIEAVIEGGASNFTQDVMDMSGEYYHKIKHDKKSERKRDIGVSGYLHRSADNKWEDAKFSQDVPVLIRSQSYESDSQSTVDGCVSPSRGIYANVTETCNWQDDDNDNDSQLSLGLEAADEDMNVAMGTWVKSGERVSDSSSYLHPIPPDDDTYNRLML